jgi:hypothetical protein
MAQKSESFLEHATACHAWQVYKTNCPLLVPYTTHIRMFEMTTIEAETLRTSITRKPPFCSGTIALS